MNQDERRDGIVDDRETPNLLVDVEAMALNDKCFGKISGGRFPTRKDTNRIPCR